MSVQYLPRSGNAKLAYVHTKAQGEGAKYPLVMFLGGYRSDMNGTKATFIEAQCKARGQAIVRFDYSGHGLSEGKFADGMIGSWKQDALDILDHTAKEPVVLVGSSMGGWVGLLVALARPGFVKGMVGIAAAPDFTEEIYQSLDATQKQQLAQKGHVSVPNHYSSDPYDFSRAFYEESKKHFLLDKVHNAGFPLRLIQGMQDEDVPWETAVKIQKSFQGAESDILFIDDGDHRLSRPEDLELIDREIRSICGI